MGSLGKLSMGSSSESWRVDEESSSRRELSSSCEFDVTSCDVKEF